MERCFWNGAGKGSGQDSLWIRGESFCSSLSWSLILLSYFLALLILHSPWFFSEEILSIVSACPVGWTGREDGRKGQTSHWHEEMGWEAKLLGLRISCTILFGCLHISFVNNPHKIYLSLHVDYKKYQRSACLFCFVSFVNSLRARSPFSNSTHSMKTLLQSIHVACTIQQQNILLGLRVLPHNCRYLSTCQL